MIGKPSTLSSMKALQQFFTDATIGVLANISGYASYLIRTYFGGAPKLTMTEFYSMTASKDFFANRRFIFRHDEGTCINWERYLLVLNLVLLLFVGWIYFPHQAVQAIAIVDVAIFLFVILRFFVLLRFSAAIRVVP